MADGLDMTRCAIGLGSNVAGERGSPWETVESALGCLDEIVGVRLVARSTLHETAPVGIEDQAWFVNACVLVDTELSARALLDEMQGIERVFGRDRALEQRWGPRTLDLDLLLYGDAVVCEEGLVVPHARMCERGFVLGPLAEICGELLVPGDVGGGRTVGVLLELLVGEGGEAR